VTGRPLEQPFAFDPTRATTAQELNSPLLAELIRLDAGISGFRQKPEETAEEYRSKVQTFGQNYSRFGLALVRNPRFRAAGDSVKRLALTALNDRAKRLAAQELEADALNADEIMDLAEAAAERRGRKQRRYGRWALDAPMPPALCRHRESARAKKNSHVEVVCG
jgi:hypothetical protein